MFSFHWHCTVWSQKEWELCPSLVTHPTATPEQAASPIQQLQASLHSSALPEPAKCSSTLLQELGITGAAFFLPFFPFPEKLVSHSVLPLLCWAWLLLAEEVGMCFWSAADGVGRSKVMAGPNWAEFVLLNINFAHLCNSPSVSWKPALTLLQSRCLVAILPTPAEFCSPSLPSHTSHSLLLLQLPQQLPRHLGTLGSLKAPLQSMLLSQKRLLFFPWRIMLLYREQQRCF